VVNLIASTSTTKGRSVQIQLDSHAYPKGRKITDRQMAQIQLQAEASHREWN
jgi:hypothetical protein